MKKYDLIKEEMPKEVLIKALYLLVDWSTDCGFGYDNMPEMYDKYEEEIKDFSYIDGLIYIAVNEAVKEL